LMPFDSTNLCSTNIGTSLNLLWRECDFEF
jgi:hypothetical protein